MLFSSAPEQSSVPSVIDMSRAQAERRLEDAGFVVGDLDREASEDYRKGQVMAQDPDPQTMLEPGAEVDLTVSTGNPDVIVPSVIGDNKDEAADQIRELGLQPRLRREESDEETDTVVRTDPEAATSVSSGSTVTIFWATGPAEVPNVVGLKQGEGDPAAGAGRLQRLGGRGSRHPGREGPGARPGPALGHPARPGLHRHDHGLDLRAPGAEPRAEPGAEPDRRALAHRRTITGCEPFRAAGGVGPAAT